VLLGWAEEVVLVGAAVFVPLGAWVLEVGVEVL